MSTKIERAVVQVLEALAMFLWIAAISQCNDCASKAGAAASTIILHITDGAR